MKQAMKAPKNAKNKGKTAKLFGTISPLATSNNRDPVPKLIKSYSTDKNGKRVRIEIIGRRKFVFPLCENNSTSWLKMSKKAIVDYAKAYCALYGITGSYKLMRGMDNNGAHKRPDLQSALVKKGLIEQVFVRERKRIILLGKERLVLPLDKRGKIDWKSMTDEKITEYAVKYCRFHKIEGSRSLKEHNSAIAYIVRRRELTDRIGLMKTRTENLGRKTFILRVSDGGRVLWKDMDDKIFEEYARLFCTVHRIEYGSEIEKLKGGLYQALRHRGLVERIFKEEERIEVYENRIFRIPVVSGRRRWARMDDEVLNIYAAMLYRASKKTWHVLPPGMETRIDRKKVREYRKEPPVLTGRILDGLKRTYRKKEEKLRVALGAYGYEPYSEIKEGQLICSGVRKLSVK